MKTQTRIIFISLLFMVLFSSAVIAQDVCEYPSDDQWFTVCIWQNHQLLSAENNSVELEKAPFTLILIMQEPMGVLVNFSMKDSLYKGFLKNEALENITDQPDDFMGMGEAPGNPEEMIVIDDLTPHYMYYMDDASHRFSHTELDNGYIIGERVISNYTSFARDFAASPLAELEADILYISLMHSEYDKDYNLIELQKEALKVIFK